MVRHLLLRRGARRAHLLRDALRGAGDSLLELLQVQRIGFVARARRLVRRGRLAHLLVPAGHAEERCHRRTLCATREGGERRCGGRDRCACACVFFSRKAAGSSASRNPRGLSKLSAVARVSGSEGLITLECTRLTKTRRHLARASNSSVSRRRAGASPRHAGSVSSSAPHSSGHRACFAATADTEPRRAHAHSDKDKREASLPLKGCP